VFPQAATVHDTLSFVKAKARDYDGAVSHILTAVSLEPNNPEWRIRLADIYQTRGDSEKALQCIREIELEYPDASKLGEQLRIRLEGIRGALQGKTAQAQ
jgi:Flp pilus assembly protein TadD